MKTIHKYPISITERQQVQLPLGAKILDAQFQGFQLCLWALVDTTMDLQPRTIFIFGTGHEMPDSYPDCKNLLHIATVQQTPKNTSAWQGGIFVWHIFE